MVVRIIRIPQAMATKILTHNQKIALKISNLIQAKTKKITTHQKINLKKMIKKMEMTKRILQQIKPSFKPILRRKIPVELKRPLF